MILKSGRIIPNFILYEAFKSYSRDQDDDEARREIDYGLNELEGITVARGDISDDDLDEVVDKFEEIIEDFWKLMDDFFERHGLGDDGWGGGNDDNNDDKNGDDDSDTNDGSNDNEDNGAIKELDKESV
jgi:hypothetical protein